MRSPRVRIHWSEADSLGLPLVTLLLLLATILGVSVLSSYDEEARWLRSGMLLFAVGLAMWLPNGWAAFWAAAISLATAFARGGLTDAGVLRPETMFEVPGIALTAMLAGLLRRQLESLTVANPREGDVGEKPAGLSKIDVEQTGFLESRATASGGPEPAVPAYRYGIRGVKLDRTEESRAFVASAKAALANLDLELRLTRMGIGDMRVRLRMG